MISYFCRDVKWNFCQFCRYYCWPTENGPDMQATEVKMTGQAKRDGYADNRLRYEFVTEI